MKNIKYQKKEHDADSKELFYLRSIMMKPSGELGILKVLQCDREQCDFCVARQCDKGCNRRH